MNSSVPPPYVNNNKIIMDLNKTVFQKLRTLVDSIKDIEINGIEDIHQSYVRQIIKPLIRTIYTKIL